jgi:hypothetical protein
MNTIQRLIRADATRKTRFHTSNGHLCLGPSEFLRACATTLRRVIFHRYSPTPWLVFPAIDYLEPLVSGKRIFEFGSGMSTLWFASRCRQVISVESDSEWYGMVRKRSRDLQNLQLVHATSEEDYLGTLSASGGQFGLILIDGFYRTQCLDLVRPHLEPGGTLVVDNTDTAPDLALKVERLFPDSQIVAFRDWGPGNLHPWETTIIRDIPGAGIRAGA